MALLADRGRSRRDSDSLGPNTWPRRPRRRLHAVSVLKFAGRPVTRRGLMSTPRRKTDESNPFLREIIRPTNGEAPPHAWDKPKSRRTDRVQRRRCRTCFRVKAIADNATDVTEPSYPRDLSSHLRKAFGFLWSGLLVRPLCATRRRTHTRAHGRYPRTRPASRGHVLSSSRCGVLFGSPGRYKPTNTRRLSDAHVRSTRLSSRTCYRNDDLFGLGHSLYSSCVCHDNRLFQSTTCGLDLVTVSNAPKSR